MWKAILCAATIHVSAPLYLSDIVIPVFVVSQTESKIFISHPVRESSNILIAKNISEPTTDSQKYNLKGAGSSRSQVKGKFFGFSSGRNYCPTRHCDALFIDKRRNVILFTAPNNSIYAHHECRGAPVVYEAKMPIYRHFNCLCYSSSSTSWGTGRKFTESLFDFQKDRWTLQFDQSSFSNLGLSSYGDSRMSSLAPKKNIPNSQDAGKNQTGNGTKSFHRFMVDSEPFSQFDPQEQEDLENGMIFFFGTVGMISMGSIAIGIAIGQMLAKNHQKKKRD